MKLIPTYLASVEFKFFINRTIEKLNYFSTDTRSVGERKHTEKQVNKMKIDIEKNMVNLIPENDQETGDVEKLWRLLVGCVTNSKKLTPVGEYLPEKENKASFYIEDASGKEPAGIEVDDNLVLEDGKYYCGTCNKLIDLKTGDEIPMCCGLRMEEID